MAVGQIYVLGGRTATTTLDSVERATVNPDGSLGAWQATTSMNTARTGEGAVATGGGVFAIGGSDIATGGISSVERSTINGDGSLSAWQFVEPLTSQRSTHVAVTDGSNLYAVGGRLDPGSNPTNSVERTTVCSPTPALPILDDFNRANGALGANWAGNVGTGIIRVNNNQAQVVGDTSTDHSLTVYWCAAPASGQPCSNASLFGANQEAYFTFSKPSANASEQNLILKAGGTIGGNPCPAGQTTAGCFNGGTVGSAGTPVSLTRTHLIEVSYVVAASQVVVNTLAPSQNWVTRATFNGITLAPGDLFLARALATGDVQLFQNGVLKGSTNVASGSNPWPAAFVNGGGRIGAMFTAGTSDFTTANDIRFDDFGGGTLP